MKELDEVVDDLEYSDDAAREEQKTDTNRKFFNKAYTLSKN